MIKVPRVVRLWLLSMGFFLGSLLTGIVFIVVFPPLNVIAWALTSLLSFGLAYLIDFKHRDLLAEWLPYFEKKEEQKSKGS